MVHRRIAVGISAGTQPPMRQIRAMVGAARTLRLDSVWVVDHFLGFIPRVLWDKEMSWLAKPGSRPHAYFDYQVVLGHLARRAGSLQIGVGVTEPIRRHPVLIAQSFMTLAHLTRKPPILGIGSGERENVTPYGLDFSYSVSRLEEALEVIRLCFDSDGPFDYAGRFFDLHGAVMDLKPPPGRVPEIWVAAHGPRMLELTGRFGDGWYPTFPMQPGEFAEKLATIHAAATKVGRDPQRIVAGMQVFVMVASTRAEARVLLRSKAARFVGLLASDEIWQKAGLSHPLGEGFKGMIDFVPESYSREELDDAIAAVPIELLEESGVWGTPADVIRKVRALGDAGLRHAVLVPASALVSRASARFTLKSLPGLTRRLRTGRD